MSRYTRRTRVTGLAAASLLVLAVAAAPVRAQTPPASPPEPVLVDDSLVNGELIGAGIGAGVGMMTVLTLASSCDVSKNCIPPSELGTALPLGIAAGAGIGLIAGMFIDKARRDPAPVAVAIRADRQMRAVRIDWRLGKRAADRVPAPLPRPRPRYSDDSTVNGFVAGTALGTMGGLFAGMGAVGRCGGNLCSTGVGHAWGPECHPCFRNEVLPPTGWVERMAVRRGHGCPRCGCGYCSLPAGRRMSLAVETSNRLKSEYVVVRRTKRRSDCGPFFLPLLR